MKYENLKHTVSAQLNAQNCKALLSKMCNSFMLNNSQTKRCVYVSVRVNSIYLDACSHPHT